MTALADLFCSYGEASAMELIARKAAMVMPILLLQKPHARSRTWDHVQSLKRRMILWESGNIDTLVQECRTIQDQLRTGQRYGNSNDNKQHTTRVFVRLMLQGKVKAALWVLDTQDKSGVLPLNRTVPSSSAQPAPQQTVRDILIQKHPPGQPAHPETLLQSSPIQKPHPVLSGLNSQGWRHLCTSFRKASSNLCNSVALLARRICTTTVDSAGLAPLTACSLVALDKCPGVCPVGIGETIRRIIAKAILRIIGPEIQEAAGSSQLCAGLESGCEAAVHAMQKIFSDENTEVILQVDANNAFNCINRQSTLRNIQVLCLSFATVLINAYRSSAELFIDGETIISQEGTTQGDPFAMSMYALGILPLIKQLDHIARQEWFADDASARGKLAQLREWWDLVVAFGPGYGYFANPSKTWLIVKPEHLSSTTRFFHDSGVNITTEGKRHIGAALGEKSTIDSYVKGKVQQWVNEVEEESGKDSPSSGLCSTHTWYGQQMDIPYENGRSHTTVAAAT